VARLLLDNVDTDQLIPARFMSRPRSEGYGGFLLHDLQRDVPEARIPKGTEILIAGRNFGCGSSREAAVYALVDFGIRVVLAPSFGDIFASNAVNNGLLPARMSAQDLGDLGQGMTIDLKNAHLHNQGQIRTFDIDPVWQTKLLNGWDDIDLTRQHAESIARYKKRRLQSASWAMV